MAPKFTPKGRAALAAEAKRRGKKASVNGQNTPFGLHLASKRPPDVRSLQKTRPTLFG